MIELTRQKTIELLRAAVADRGADYVYEKQPDEQGGFDCQYVHGTEMVLVDQNFDSGYYRYEEQATGDLTPGCIVGHVLINAGIHPIEFLELEVNRDTGADVLLGQLAHNGYLSFDPGVDSLLEVAQNNQDQSASWGDAVELAISHTKRGTDAE